MKSQAAANGDFKMENTLLKVLLLLFVWFCFVFFTFKLNLLKVGINCFALNLCFKMFLLYVNKEIDKFQNMIFH